MGPHQTLSKLLRFQHKLTLPLAIHIHTS